MVSSKVSFFSPRKWLTINSIVVGAIARRQHLASWINKIILSIIIVDYEKLEEVLMAVKLKNFRWGREEKIMKCDVNISRMMTLSSL